MMHSVPVRLHWVHSDAPFGTTQRILLSRHEAQATEALCLTCCLVGCLAGWFRGETFSGLEASVRLVSGRDLDSDLAEVILRRRVIALEIGSLNDKQC